MLNMFKTIFSNGELPSFRPMRGSIKIVNGSEDIWLEQKFKILKLDRKIAIGIEAQSETTESKFLQTQIYKFSSNLTLV